MKATRRNFLRASVVAPAAAWLTQYRTLAAPAGKMVKITAIQALQLDNVSDGCLIRIQTDAGLTGYGEAGVSAAMARARIAAFELQKSGHEIYVYTSRNAYEDNNIQYLAKEQHLGVNIERLRHTSFGKKSVLGRLSDFYTFNVRLLFKMLTVQKRQYDLIFGTTVPPLVSYIGVQVAKWKRIPFCYWTMDLQPELAIASGMIGKKSVYAKILSYISNHIIKKSDVIFTLDNYMKEYLKKQGADPKKIHGVEL